MYWIDVCLIEGIGRAESSRTSAIISNERACIGPRDLNVTIAIDIIEYVHVYVVYNICAIKYCQ